MNFKRSSTLFDFFDFKMNTSEGGGGSQRFFLRKIGVVLCTYHVHVQVAMQALQGGGVGVVVVAGVVVGGATGGGGGLAPFCKPPLEQAGTFVSSRERQMVVRGGSAVKAIVVADLRATYSTLLYSQLVSDLFLSFLF